MRELDDDWEYGNKLDRPDTSSSIIMAQIVNEITRSAMEMKRYLSTQEQSIAIAA